MSAKTIIDSDSHCGKTLNPHEAAMVLKAIERGLIKNEKGAALSLEDSLDINGDIVVDGAAYIDCLKAAGIQTRFMTETVAKEKNQPALPWQNPCPECGRPIPPRRPNQRGPSPTVCSDRCRKRKQRRQAKTA